MRTEELQELLRRKEKEWRQREDQRRLEYEEAHRKAEERRGREQQKWKEEEWKRELEEERKAHTEDIKKWVEKEALLNSEVSIIMY